MKRSTFNINFFIKKKKLLKNGEAPIILRITVNGTSSELSIKRSTMVSLWDNKRNKLKGNSEKAKEINDCIQSIESQLFNHQKNIQESGKIVTAILLKNAFLGLGEKQWTIKELFIIHNDNIKSLIGNGYAKGTVTKFKTCLQHIVNYCNLNYHSDHVLLSDVDHKFIVGFELYLKTIGKCQHNTAIKYVKSFKKIVRIALANDYIRRDPFLNYKVKLKTVSRICLTQAEIDRLIEKDFSIKRLEVVRDLFIFQCYTGLAYKDMYSLKKENIILGIDGHKWIIKRRVKTKIESRIPILPQAQEILTKYINDPCHLIGNRLLPVPSNQKMNAYLKEIADLCGIEKSICSHIGRHTFATTVTLSNGVAIETVSKMLGHTEIQTTQIYAKVLDDKISRDIDKLRNNLAS
ncbi:MAG: recombinase [Flavobacteriales bacterium]|nr:MAG: recombinase [Flavobacteriales bacterium]